MPLIENFVSVKRFAHEIGLDRSHVRRCILKLGIIPKKRRTRDSNNQLALTITKEEADTIRAIRKEQGFGSEAKTVENEHGYFYVVQLVPELDPRRIKLGYANNWRERLKQHRTASPTAKMVGAWACKRTWELTVMDALSSVNCKHILNEVFECEDIDEIMQYGDKLFNLLPDPQNIIALSDYSPYNRHPRLN